MNLDGEKGVLEFAERKRDEMRRCFERLGRFEENGFSFAAWLLLTHLIVPPKSPGDRDDWKTGKPIGRVFPFPAKQPREIHALTDDPVAQKEAFSRTVRTFARLGKAVGVLFMGEVWTVHAPESVKSHDEARTYREGLPDSLEDVPGRKECLLCTLEHKAVGRRAWWADIEREPTRLGPWQERSFSGAEGRMVNLVEGWQS